MFAVLLVMMADTPVAVQPPSAQEKLICKREPVTGSLARFRKICRTEVQWAMMQNDAQDETRAMQDRGLINSESPR